MLADILRIYNKDEKYLILNPLVPAWIVTNINGVLIIKQLDDSKDIGVAADKFCERSNNLDKKAVLAYLNKIKKIGLLTEKAQEKKHKPYMLSTVYLNMTKQCNLSCTYCFAATRVEHGSDNLTFEDYKRLLNELYSINPNMRIIYTGGEPLLSPNTLKVARYAKKLGFTNRILTNATLINESNISEIIELFDFFKISVDGSNKERHEHYRGVGSYDKTMNAIELLKKNNINYSVAMVVTKENKDDVLNMNEKWGDHLEYQPLFPLGRASGSKQSIALTGEEYFDTLSTSEKINPYADLNNILEMHKKENTIIKCAIGDGEISVSCTGDIYPCQLLHNEDCLIGNLKNDGFSNLYNSSKMDKYKFNTVDKIDKCRECDLRYLCGGTCQARHYSETGSVNKTGDFCSYEKKAIINGLLLNAKLIQL